MGIWDELNLSTTSEMSHILSRLYYVDVESISITYPQRIQNHFIDSNAFEEALIDKRNLSICVVLLAFNTVSHEMNQQN